jgi:hypothetical protein
MYFMESMRKHTVFICECGDIYHMMIAMSGQTSAQKTVQSTFHAVVCLLLYILRFLNSC